MTQKSKVAGEKKIRLSVLHPSPENELIYREDDEDIAELAENMKREGQLEALVVTLDNFIVSGHRRYYALLQIGFVYARCVQLKERRSDYSKDEYLRLLRSYNRQRDKSAEEKIREELLDVDDDAVDALYKRRAKVQAEPSANGIQVLKVEGHKVRYEISSDKEEHVKRILQVLYDREEFWPLSDRGVHYPLLNFHFIRGYYHPRRGDEDWGQGPRTLYYQNDRASYQATVDLLVRLRLNGTVPWKALADPTRPVTEFRPFDNIRHFVQQEKRKLFDGYWRNLLQSQPNHVEVLCEKNTIYHMVLQVTKKYQITTRSARGINCIDSFHDMAEDFKASGKDGLDVITLSDHDPEGSFIPHDAGRRLRDDFGIDNVRIIPAGVTREQIHRYHLPSNNVAKEESSHYDWYVSRNGGDATTWELEALDPRDMLADLETVIKGVINLDLFNREVAEERREMRALEALRQSVLRSLPSMDDLNNL
jgi:hypothetical protein